jgi:predicted AAA+ superfamily ATPase
MFQRLFYPIISRSFLLFGARGVGKTSWLQHRFQGQAVLWIDLLDEDVFERYSLKPQRLDAELKQLLATKALPPVVIIDEVQRVPRLLNVAQKWIQREGLIFILTGSSARKLRRGGANLLGGRANSYGMFPLTMEELGEKFHLQSALEWGTLPELIGMRSNRERHSYLKSYCSTYLKEEILVEQLIRRLPPFREFLSILAQNQGKLLNYQKFARDVGVDNKTIQAYIEILEETYLGVLLRPYHPSLRKSQLLSPKFYFFDCGVQRQLAGMAGTPLNPRTSVYGDVFEAFIIQEVHRMNMYTEEDYNLSFYASKHGFEVDLILARNQEHIFVEIKSTERVDEVEARSLEVGLSDIPVKPSRLIYLSRDPVPQRIGRVECLHYQEFLQEIFRAKRENKPCASDF